MLDELVAQFHGRLGAVIAPELWDIQVHVRHHGFLPDVGQAAAGNVAHERVAEFRVEDFGSRSTFTPSCRATNRVAGAECAPRKLSIPPPPGLLSRSNKPGRFPLLVLLSANVPRGPSRLGVDQYGKSPDSPSALRLAATNIAREAVYRISSWT